MNRDPIAFRDEDSTVAEHVERALMVAEIMDGKSIRVGGMDVCAADILRRAPLIDCYAYTARDLTEPQSERDDQRTIARRQLRILAEQWALSPQGEAALQNRLEAKREQSHADRDCDIEYELAQRGPGIRPVEVVRCGCGCVYHVRAGKFESECPACAEDV